MTFFKFYFHIVWATKKRTPLIRPEMERFVYKSLTAKAQELEAQVFAINGMADHVHMIASVPPKIGFSKFMSLIKGSTSRYITLEYRIPFHWQRGYSAFTFSRRGLKYAVAYVENQKTH